MIVSTISTGDTAYWLRRELGPMRNWQDFLSDAIRDRAFIKGFTLLPCCEIHDGRAFRPRYNAREVLNFINAVKAAYPEAGPNGIVPIKLDITPTSIWKINKFDKDGSPIRAGKPPSTSSRHRPPTGLPPVCHRHATTKPTGAAVLPR